MKKEQKSSKDAETGLYCSDGNRLDENSGT